MGVTLTNRPPRQLAKFSAARRRGGHLWEDNVQPYFFKVAIACQAGHETELFSARIDPADTSTLAAAESKIGEHVRLAECLVCGGVGATVRIYTDESLVEEFSLDEFNARAAGKAPPRNYG